MKEININTWSRKQHFEFFYRMDYPQYNICMYVDAAHFVQYTDQYELIIPMII